MVELKTYKYKLYNRDALKYLDGILVIAGRIYNHCIALHRRYYGIYHKMLNKYQLQKYLTKLKRQYPEWNEVPSQAIQDITDRIDRAYRLFFSNLKAGKKTNPPHFQKSAKYRSFTTKQSGYKFHDSNRVKIGKKDFPYWNSRDFNGKVKTLTVKRKSNGFYIYIVVEQECTQTEWTKSGEIVGFDFSLHDFLVSSNGDKLHEKVANQRSDMHWKMARQMCRDYDVMVFETLDLANMSRKYKKSMYDFGLNAFLNILEYVAHKTGKTVMYADKYYPSSQLCSECGYQNHLLKDVSIREWTCPVCGCHHDRDLNAARNLCKVGASTFGICCSP